MLAVIRTGSRHRNNLVAKVPTVVRMIGHKLITIESIWLELHQAIHVVTLQSWLKLYLRS